LGYVRRERQFEHVEGAMWGVSLCVCMESLCCMFVCEDFVGQNNVPVLARIAFVAHNVLFVTIFQFPFRVFHTLIRKFTGIKERVMYDLSDSLIIRRWHPNLEAKIDAKIKKRQTKRAVKMVEYALAIEKAIFDEEIDFENTQADSPNLGVRFATPEKSLSYYHPKGILSGVTEIFEEISGYFLDAYRRNPSSTFLATNAYLLGVASIASPGLLTGLTAKLSPFLTKTVIAPAIAVNKTIAETISGTPASQAVTGGGIPYQATRTLLNTIQYGANSEAAKGAAFAAKHPGEIVVGLALALINSRPSFNCFITSSILQSRY